MNRSQAFLTLAVVLLISCSGKRKWPHYDIMRGTNGKWAYVLIGEDGQQKMLTDFIYDDARHFQANEVARVIIDGKFALIDRNFEYVSAFYPEMSMWIGENLIAFRSDKGLYGFIDAEGEEVIPPTYPEVHFIVQDNDHVSVRNDEGEWALLNADNEVVIDFKYRCYIEYRDGYAVSCEGENRYGVMTLDGKPVIPFEHTRVTALKKGKFVVKDGDTTSVVDHQQKQIFACTSCDIYQPTHLTRFVLRQGTMLGLVDDEGNIIVQPKYDRFHKEAFGMLVYGIGRRQGLISGDGTDLLGNTYEHVEIIRENEVRYFTDHWEYKKFDKKAE